MKVASKFLIPLALAFSLVSCEKTDDEDVTDPVVTPVDNIDTLSVKPDKAIKLHDFSGGTYRHNHMNYAIVHIPVLYQETTTYVNNDYANPLQMKSVVCDTLNEFFIHSYQWNSSCSYEIKMKTDQLRLTGVDDALLKGDVKSNYKARDKWAIPTDNDEVYYSEISFAGNNIFIFGSGVEYKDGVSGNTSPEWYEKTKDNYPLRLFGNFLVDIGLNTKDYLMEFKDNSGNIMLSLEYEKGRTRDYFYDVASSIVERTDINELSVKGSFVSKSKYSVD